MGRAAAQVAAAFMARAAVQIPIKVVIISNLARQVSSSSRVDSRVIQGN